MLNLILFSNLRFDLLILKPTNESGVSIPSKLDNFKRKANTLKFTLLHKAYLYFKRMHSHLNQLLAKFHKQKADVREGLQHYKEMAFWWKVDESKYGKTFR